MNYYEEIKNELINNEVYKKVKDYSKNRNDLITYYNVGKLLIEAQGGEERAKYGNKLIKVYSKKLEIELGKKYNERTLRRMRQLYILFKNIKWSTMSTKLSWSHYQELLVLVNKYEIDYYIQETIKHNLTIRQLREKIKSKEYQRLDKNTKQKLILEERTGIDDFIKNPIVIRNTNNIENISEKVLKKLILEDIEHFMNELGSGYSFIGSEYRINIGDNYNYIDLLLFNIEFNCYVVIELKIVELKKEHIGQIEVYMNYLDKNLKNASQNKTIGIIICKKDNKFVMEYASDERVYSRSYELV